MRKITAFGRQDCGLSARTWPPCLVSGGCEDSSEIRQKFFFDSFFGDCSAKQSLMPVVLDNSKRVLNKIDIKVNLEEKDMNSETNVHDNE